MPPKSGSRGSVAVAPASVTDTPADPIPKPKTRDRTVIAPTALDLEAEGQKTRLKMFNSMSIPTGGSVPLQEVAVSAFRYYAMFTWLVTSGYGNTIIGKFKGAIANLRDNGPSSVYVTLDRGADDKSPASGMATRVNATDRLILLALIADRPELIPATLRVFPDGVSNPALLSLLLEPYTNSSMIPPDESGTINVRRRYTGLSIQELLTDKVRAKTPFEEAVSVITKLPLYRGIAVLSRLRENQNAVLRDMIRVRFALISALADPSVFSPASLTQVDGLVARAETAVLSSPEVYSDLRPALDMLKRNLEMVRGTVTRSAVITKDAVRRLRILTTAQKAGEKAIQAMLPKYVS